MVGIARGALRNQGANANWFVTCCSRPVPCHPNSRFPTCFRTAVHARSHAHASMHTNARTHTAGTHTQNCEGYCLGALGLGYFLTRWSGGVGGGDSGVPSPSPPPSPPPSPSRSPSPPSPSPPRRRRRRRSLTQVFLGLCSACLQNCSFKKKINNNNRFFVFCFCYLNVFSRGYGAMAARLTPDQKVGSSNLSALI